MKKIRVLAIALAASLALALPAAAYTDVDGHWAEGDIAEATERELFAGVSESRFAPEQPMSRAMAITVIWRFVGRPAYETEPSFPDVAPNSYYSAPLRWAARCGITNGDEFGNFRPDDPVTREEFAALVLRALEQEYPERFAGQMSSPEFYAASFLDHGAAEFADGSTSSYWAAQALGWATSVGVLRGDDGGNLRPTASLTRAEAAAIFCRVAELYEQK